MTDRTLLDLYRHDVDHPRSDHYRHLLPGRPDRVLSTADFLRRTAALASALEGLGIGHGDRVLLLSDNRPEWHMVDLAVLDLGAADVPVYGTLTAEQVAYQAADSGAVAVVAENAEQVAKFLEVRSRCPALAHLIQIEGEPAPGVISFDDLVTAGGTSDAVDRFWRRAHDIDEEALATLIYTSGTTGDPKGVMLSHRNLVENIRAAAPRVPVMSEDHALEFLPLCHVLERMVGYIYMWRGTTKAYCSVYHVGDLIAAAAPTLFVGVPRFFEKVHQKIHEKVAGASGLRRSLFHWAIDTGREVAHQRIAGKQPGAVLSGRYAVAERLVLAKVRDAVFGGRVRYAISGGAELPLPVNEFFHALGVPVVEGYGLTETSPVIAVNGVTLGTLRLGTVGRPLENLEVKLAPDGELLVRGPSVMMGYWNKPEQTAEVLDDEAFLHTGDIAELDDDGFVLIVDRKKDLIVTAGGKNIAPQPIEGRLKESPFVDAAVLVGDRRPFVVALIAPSLDDLQRWAGAHGVGAVTAAEMLASPEVEQLFADLVSTVNAGLARYEQIKRFALLPEPLTVEGGQLTPTMKVKRRVIEQQLGNVIEGLYEPVPPSA